MPKLNVYVDGFNLYFGMMDAGYRDCKWLDIYSLINQIKPEKDEINSVKYFTSRINNDFPKQKRQNAYLDAIGTTPVTIIPGQYKSQLVHCKNCGAGWWDSKEKMTDVNIASHMLADAYKNEFDTAFLISGDSDLVPPVKLIKEIFPEKKVWVIFPPERKSNELKLYAAGCFTLGHKKLAASQFPSVIIDKYGNTVQKPADWR